MTEASSPPESEPSPEQQTGTGAGITAGSRVTSGCRVPKGWGEELIIENNQLYCGKLLILRRGLKFSMHYHLLKDETWYVAQGEFIYRWIDTESGLLHEQNLKPGDVVRHRPGQPHQLEAVTDATVFEVSTQHVDTDTYRIARGD